MCVYIFPASLPLLLDSILCVLCGTFPVDVINVFNGSGIFHTQFDVSLPSYFCSRATFL